MFPDVWARLLQMEKYSKGYCAIVAGIPDWKNPRAAIIWWNPKEIVSA